MVAVAAQPSSIVAVGAVAGTGAVAWWSTDGSAWSRATLAGPSATVADVTASAGKWVAVGWTHRKGHAVAAAWWSEDGRSWKSSVVPGGAGVELTRVATAAT
jgi:hypothetical protein